ncbi:hypothetical protein FHT44_003870 [Mycolicibacterium sp. BK634]|uniref:hypothetical protein n=1 Tax=Mycolicibacterium sp. BK634 TaxID=2587099 RepID=UPI001608913D|nr:hypothetical protein [Mycolicibacterium sp. BK634]MBB3751375.1 hypothetical protein [Mycolicibacterium sp. BK634]
MPEPVAVDPATLRALAGRLTRAADDLAAIPIRGLDALPGSALGGLTLPRRVTAEVRRLGAAVQEWVCSADRSVDELAAADRAGAERLPPQ